MMPTRPPVHRPFPGAKPRAYDATRTPDQKLYGAQWRAARTRFLAEFPFCAGTTEAGEPCTAPATDVDHITPHRGDLGLFWNRANWQPLCHGCHSRKTRAEGGRSYG